MDAIQAYLQSAWEAASPVPYGSVLRAGTYVLARYPDGHIESWTTTTPIFATDRVRVG